MLERYSCHFTGVGDFSVWHTRSPQVVQLAKTLAHIPCSLPFVLVTQTCSLSSCRRALCNTWRGKKRKISTNEPRTKPSTHLPIAFGLYELTPAHAEELGSERWGAGPAYPNTWPCSPRGVGAARLRSAWKWWAWKRERAEEGMLQLWNGHLAKLHTCAVSAIW